MKFPVVLTTIFTFLSLSALAQTQSELANVLSLIGKAQGQLHESGKNCIPEDKATCSLESLCSKAAENANSLYLATDSEGHKVINSSLLQVLTMAEMCGEQPQLAALAKDPFTFPQAMIDERVAGSAEQLKKNKELYQQSKVRNQRIFEDAKKKVIAVLEARKKSGSDSGIDNLIARVRSTKLDIKDYTSMDQLYSEGCSGANAYYRPDAASVHLCPQYMNFPEGNIFSIFAHEIGHSIDPCSTAYETIDGKILEAPPSQAMKKQSNYLASLSLDKNPLVKVVSCLMSNKSINAQVPSKQKALSVIDERARAVLDDRESRYEGEEGEEMPSDAFMAQIDDEKAALEQSYDAFKFCPHISGGGHVAEASADWIASQAMGLKLAEIPESAKAKEFAWFSQSNFMSRDCQAVKETAKKTATKAITSGCLSRYPLEEALELNHTEADSHPDSRRRTNRIYFAQPEIKKALGCQGGENAVECK